MARTAWLAVGVAAVLVAAVALISFLWPGSAIVQQHGAIGVSVNVPIIINLAFLSLARPPCLLCIEPVS